MNSVLFEKLTCVRYGYDVLLVNDQLLEKFDRFWEDLIAKHATKNQPALTVDQIADLYSATAYREMWPDFHPKSDPHELADMVYDRHKADDYIKKIEEDLHIQRWQTGKWKRPDSWKRKKRSR